uniref:WGS project CAEQ00000000 data, annotated contig 516 n=1 Tax=Trypanosoma congolense (strain IL3000) TaxID=1068625 RepID=F9WGL9_TRYCI|nr:unnamed protein product [Trypanosoma congolense IL3000]
MTYMDKRVRLQIWDTAGQERFQSVATAFYRGANGVMLCFDLTHRSSFLHLDQWMERVRQQSLPGIPCLLVGCKSDEARNLRQVSKEEAMAWAKKHGMSYIDTSAKEKENVQNAFQKIAEEIFKDMKDRNGSGPAGVTKARGSGGAKTLSRNEERKSTQSGGGCC